MNEVFRRFVKKPLKSIALKYSIERFHNYQNNMALSFLNNIEKQNGKLDVNSKRRADEYAIKILGSKKYAPWLYVYSALRKSFKYGWIPGNYYGLIITPLINGGYSSIDSLRTLTNRILGTSTIPDTAYLIDGILYSSYFKPVEQQDVMNTIFKNSDVVFFKLNDTAQGKGVELIEKTSFDISKSMIKKDGCFQSIIYPHDFFKQITKNSTSTIRITTVRDHVGKVSVRAAYLRVGRNMDFMVKSANAIKIPIDLSSGLLGEFGFMPDWSFSVRHPDTGFLYLGNKIPFFDDAKNLCKSLHESFPHFSIIGWDSCINQNDEVKIMEWNANQTDIVFSEATTGPCFLDLGWENLWRKLS